MSRASSTVIFLGFAVGVPKVSLTFYIVKIRFELSCLRVETAAVKSTLPAFSTPNFFEGDAMPLGFFLFCSDSFGEVMPRSILS